MKHSFYCLLVLLLMFSCANRTELVIEDLSSLYISLADTSSDTSAIRQNIETARADNCLRLEVLSAKKFNDQIRLFSQKISRESNQIIQREYYRELESYKQLYYGKNYDNLRLSDIPLAYRRSNDKLEGQAHHLVTFNDDHYIIIGDTYTLSGNCITSAQRLTVSVGNKIIAEHRYNGDETRTFADTFTVGQELTAGENILTIRIYRRDSRMTPEYYDCTRTILLINESQHDVVPNEHHFIVKQTNKSEIFHYNMYEIDLSKAEKTLDRYVLTNGNVALVLQNVISEDKLFMTAVINGQTTTLFENTPQSKNILSVKWYDDGDIIIEYYTGEQNYTDYLLYCGGKLIKAGTLMANFDISYPIIATRISDYYLIAHYGEKDTPVQLYYFDTSLELQSIRKQKIDKYLYKQFGNDELFYEL